MTQNPHHLPENTSIAMPRLACQDAAAEMEVCARTFEAEELNRRLGPDGTVAHGLLRIGGELVMIEGEWRCIRRRTTSLEECVSSAPRNFCVRRQEVQPRSPIRLVLVAVVFQAGFP